MLENKEQSIVKSLLRTFIDSLSLLYGNRQG